MKQHLNVMRPSSPRFVPSYELQAKNHEFPHYFYHSRNQFQVYQSETPRVRVISPNKYHQNFRVNTSGRIHLINGNLQNSPNNIYYTRPNYENNVQYLIRNNTIQKSRLQLPIPTQQTKIIYQTDSQKMINWGNPAEIGLNRQSSSPTPRSPTKVNIRFISPAVVNIKPQTQYRYDGYDGYKPKNLLLNAQQPRKPSILKQKRPGIRRMNSQGSDSNHRSNYQIYVHYDGADTHKNSVRNFTQILNNNDSIGKQSIGNIQDQNPYIRISNRDIPSLSIMELVNSTPRKEEVSRQFERLNDEKRLAQIDMKMKENLAIQVELNYDYFEKLERTDRSISGNIQLANQPS